MTEWVSIKKAKQTQIKTKESAKLKVANQEKIEIKSVTSQKKILS